MCGIVGSVITFVIGAILVIVTSIITYVVIPNVIEDIIIDTVVLKENTEQFERFETLPFSINVSIFVFNITNVEGVLNGEIPEVTEVGPYKYNLYVTRNVTDIDGDFLSYTRTEHFEFNAENSYPYNEDDLVTIVNVPYHAIAQIAERDFPGLIPLLSMALDGVFAEHNSPIMEVRVGDLLFEGVPMCKNPGLIGAIACAVIRDIAAGAKNIDELEDGSLLFSVFGYKQGVPSEEYKIHRGLEDHAQLGLIRKYNETPYLTYWPDSPRGEEEEEKFTPNVCNMINGTDTGIFAPFIDTKESLYALNLDICRSVELRYESDIDFEGIPAVRYTVNEWLLNNKEGCFCLNVSHGINREDGCLLEGGMELYSCIGGYLVLSYPHFLYADKRYVNSVFGMRPVEDLHRIFIDLEPLTGTPVRAAKRAQFNVFSRSVAGLPAIEHLRTSLIPILWLEEDFSLPDDLIDEIKTRLFRPLNLISILLPLAIALCALVTLIGLVVTIRARRAKTTASPISTTQASK